MAAKRTLHRRPAFSTVTAVALQDLDLRMSETAFGNHVLDLAIYLGWYRHHGRAAPTRSGGYATPVQGDTGFPDSVLVHATHGLVVAEWKAENGGWQPGQREWLTRIAMSGTPTYLWKPRHWRTSVVPVLNGHRSADDTAAWTENRWLL